MSEKIKPKPRPRPLGLKPTPKVLRRTTDSIPLDNYDELENLNEPIRPKLKPTLRPLSNTPKDSSSSSIEGPSNESMSGNTTASSTETSDTTTGIRPRPRLRPVLTPNMVIGGKVPEMGAKSDLHLMKGQRSQDDTGTNFSKDLDPTKVYVTMEVGENPMKAAARSKLDTNQPGWSLTKWREFMEAHKAITFEFVDEDRLAQLVYGWFIVHDYEQAKRRALANNPGLTESQIVPGKGFPALGMPSPPQAGPKPGTPEKSWGMTQTMAEQVPVQQAPVAPAVEIAPVIRVNDLLEKSKLSNFATPGPLVLDPTLPKEELRSRVEQTSLINAGAAPNTLEQRAMDIKAIEAIAEESIDPIEQQWRIAEGLAFKSEEELAPVLDENSYLALMVRHVQYWYRETSTMPEHTKDLTALYWPKQLREGTPEANARREEIVGRINKFLGKPEINLSFNPIDDRANSAKGSYRVTLASRNLEAIVESYATAYRRQDFAENAEAINAELSNAVKQAAVIYATAHGPIEAETNAPGPIATIDPPYVDYLRLCDKYKIPVGTLLHEATNL